MNTTKPIYNGKSIRGILRNLPNGMIKAHRNLYINNCITVYKNEYCNMNLDYCQAVRNTNFNLIQFYN